MVFIFACDIYRISQIKNAARAFARGGRFSGPVKICFKIFLVTEHPTLNPGIIIDRFLIDFISLPEGGYKKSLGQKASVTTVLSISASCLTSRGDALSPLPF